MVNWKSLSFEELVSENKREILQNEDQWEDFEDRLVKKQTEQNS